MEILIRTNTSEKVSKLSEVTGENQSLYADRHGYKWRCDYLDYENLNDVIVESLLDLRRDVLKNDVVVAVGADVLFMNQKQRIEDLIVDSDHVVMAYERTSWWIVNNDVMIYKNTPQTISFIDRIIDDFEIWKNYVWSIQMHIWNLIQEDEDIKNTIRLVEPSVMNQHPSRWQIGDFILHMYNMEVKEKVLLAKKMKTMFPDWMPVWKEKIFSNKPLTM